MTIKLKPVDAVVVGIGVAGSILCKELAMTGLRVVGLERGRMLDPVHDFALPYAHDELKYEATRSDILQNLSRETITFRNTTGEFALPMRQMGSFRLGECVGGAGAHWGTIAFRFAPSDFRAHSHVVERYGSKQLPENCTIQDWGLSYEELEPYYDQFEHIYGVGGKAGNLEGVIQPGGNPFEGARTREYPNPPASLTYSGALFKQACESLGYTPFPTPSAAMTQAYTNLYRLMLSECTRGGFCPSHGCSQNARGTPLTTVVPSLSMHQNFELRPHSNVVRINLDSDGKRAVGVTYIDARGREVEQPADLVVLSSYTFNNTRLLLLSGIGKPYDPASDSGVVGKNYSYSTAGGKVWLFFEDRVFNSFISGGAQGVAIDEFGGDNFDHAGLGFIGGAHLTATNISALPIAYRPVPKGTPAWGPEWKQTMAHYYDRSIATHGACQSYRNCYLDLDPNYRDAYGLPLARLTFDWQENDLKMAAYIGARAAEIATAVGPARMDVIPVSGKYSIAPYQSTHNTGGAIMGADPATSVVNKYLQSWDVPNVFVVGGSAFPQNSDKPPTATIGALACWAADALKDHYLRRPGPLV